MNSQFLSDVSNLSRGSHAKVKIECMFKQVSKCRNIVELEYRSAMDTLERNNGKFICLYCSRHLTNSGLNNPNNKYSFNHNLFNTIDNDEKAYLLGWIASYGHISKSKWSIMIKIKDSDIECLKKLRDIVCEDIPITIQENNMIGMTINSKQMCIDICNILKINRGKKSHTVNFPELENDYLTWVFLRGYFEGDGSIRHINRNTPECCITSSSIDMLNGISKFCKIPHNKINNIDIVFNSTNCIDFLGNIYRNIVNNLFLKRKYELYLDWINWKCRISRKNSARYLDTCKIFKTDKNAILPDKKNISDVGYDLTIIKEVKKLNENTTLYDTGLKISVTYGYYIEIVPRSSLSKSGYILSNSIGIIEKSYNGNLYVSLTKVDQNSKDIELPFRCCQLIFKQQIYMDIIEVVDDLNKETTRNNGGFGSTS
jgi:deoxyuridine 5'-triphosphate nucleotidohydrolase